MHAKIIVFPYLHDVIWMRMMTVCLGGCLGNEPAIDLCTQGGWIESLSEEVENWITSCSWLSYLHKSLPLQSFYGEERNFFFESEALSTCIFIV